jgi:hypothetical protein
MAIPLTDVNKNLNKIHPSEILLFNLLLNNYVDLGGKMWKKAKFETLPGIDVAGLMKTTERLGHDILYSGHLASKSQKRDHFSQLTSATEEFGNNRNILRWDSLLPHQDSNRVPPKYKIIVLLLHGPERLLHWYS